MELIYTALGMGLGALWVWALSPRTEQAAAAPGRIPLQRAFLCVECHSVVESAQRGVCAGCGSRAVLSLDKVMAARLAQKIAPQVMAGVGPSGIERVFADMAAPAEHDRAFLRPQGIQA